MPVLSQSFENCSSRTAEADAHSVKIPLRATAREAHCPPCNHPSDRVHSRYERKLADLPWQGQAVRIHIEVRRFYCPVWQCPRRIFAKRLPFATAFARTTSRLRSLHTDIALFLGGEAGAHLAKRLAMTTSPDTLLRRIRQMPWPAVSPVCVLGVNDWSFRHGQRYGTILCDLERRCAVDLLPERSADALSQWLVAHPEVAIISRDRADDYIKRASAGAPQALQVADRWHLLRNLRDALRRLVDRLPSKIREIVGSQTSSPAAVSNTTAGTEELQEEPRQTRQYYVGLDALRSRRDGGRRASAAATGQPQWLSATVCPDGSRLLVRRCLSLPAAGALPVSDPGAGPWQEARQEGWARPARTSSSMPARPVGTPTESPTGRSTAQVTIDGATAQPQRLAGKHGRYAWAYAMWRMDFSSIAWVRQSYRRRFRIESSYRLPEAARAGPAVATRVGGCGMSCWRPCCSTAGWNCGASLPQAASAGAARGGGGIAC